MRFDQITLDSEGEASHDEHEIKKNKLSDAFLTICVALTTNEEEYATIAFKLINEIM
jgi:hypothetical protein